MPVARWGRLPFRRRTACRSQPTVGNDAYGPFSPDPLVEERRRQLGRRLLFTTRTDLTARQVIRFYNHDKAALEENFKEIKSPDLVRLSPLRHFSPEFAQS